MKDTKPTECKISHMTIENGIVSWENNAIRLSGIVGVEIGGIPEKSLSIYMALIPLMIALSSPKALNLMIMLVLLAVCMLTCVISRKSAAKAGRANHINLQLCNGNVYSFKVEKEAFACRFYEIFQNLLDTGVAGAHYEIFFEEEGEIIDFGKKGETVENAEEVWEMKPEGQIKPEPEPDHPMQKELKKLYQHCAEKTDVDKEMIALIGEARALFAQNDREGLKSVFGRFVTSGLIKDCNELGLGTLLQEIKNAVF